MGGWMAVVLWVAAAVLLAAAAALSADQPPFWLRLVIVMAQSVGAACLLAGVLLAVRRPLSRWAERQLRDIAGPGLIGAMSPRAALGALLARLYGSQPGTQEILTGILG